MTRKITNIEKALKQFPQLRRIKDEWRLWGVKAPDVVMVYRANKGDIFPKFLQSFAEIGKAWICLYIQDEDGNFGGIQRVVPLEKNPEKTWRAIIMSSVKDWTNSRSQVRVMSIFQHIGTVVGGGEMYFVFRPSQTESSLNSALNDSTFDAIFDEICRPT